MANICEDCGKSYVYAKDLRRHHMAVHQDAAQFLCEVCGRSYKRSDVFKRHARIHGSPTHRCEVCGSSFNRKWDLIKHKKSHEDKHVPVKRKVDTEPETSAKRRKMEAPKESAFCQRLTTWSLKNTDHHVDLSEFLLSKKQQALELIKEKLENHGLKVNFRVNCVYQKICEDEIVKKNVSFKTKNQVILQATDLDAYYTSVIDKLLAESEDFQEKDSGWSLDEILELEVRLNKYNPLKASSYMDLPAAIKNRRAVINVQNNDQECFRWAVLSALFPADDNAKRVSNYEIYRDMLCFDDMTFPVTLNQISKFEKMNHLSVNVYSFSEDFSIYPLRISDCESGIHVDLLYFKNEGQGHYCWIKNLSRLVSKQLTKNRKSKYLCKRCLLYFNSEYQLFQHREMCKYHEAVRVEMPSKDNNQLTFTNIHHVQRVPFVVYADFECLTVPISTCDPSSSDSYTNIVQRHEPMSFCYYIAYVNGHYKDPVIYRGPDAPKRFIEMLRKEAEDIEKLYNEVKPMEPLDKESQNRHDEASVCYLCQQPFSEHDGKVYDHCHMSGKYRGPSHHSCNLKNKNPHVIPVIFHNLSCYDAHIFVKELGYDDTPITLIPNTEERYISFSKKVTEKLTLRFIDSFRFMASSLDELSGNLSKECFEHTRQYFPKEKLDLVLRKGVYPYDYMDSMEKCKDTQLPPKEDFYNKLNESELTDEDYEHALKVWKAFDIQTLGEYSDLYVKTDVLLLCDVFENFRTLCLKTYKLDPAWYYTAPGLSWDAMLKFTRVSIELLTDYDMLLFVEKGIRGGISQCSNRFGEANNKHMPNYDPQKASKYLMYLDFNNLYGSSMCEYLPLNGFEWCKPIHVQDIPDDSPIGYILEVDLEYPIQLHELHSDMPLAPELLIPEGCKEQRLLTTLNSKQKYVLHYRNLKQYVDLGMKLVRFIECSNSISLHG